MAHAIVESEVRVGQYEALAYFWNYLNYHTKKDTRVELYSQMKILAHGENVDFEELLKDLEAGLR